MGIKVLSLFDGISCGQVALNKLGVEVDKYYAYEIDEAAIEITQYNYPNTIQGGDVYKADFTKHTDCDLLIGGSPCTYWSIAKAGDNRETTSSGIGFDLFMQYVRALIESKVKYFLYENNASISKEIQKEISKKLGVEPIEINSSIFSAQDRKRLYWTNIPHELIIPELIDKNFSEESDLVFKDIEYPYDYREISFEKYKDTVKINYNDTIVYWDTSGKGNYSQQSRARKNTIKMNTVPASGTDKNNIWLGEHTYRKIHPIEAERLQTLPDNYTSCLKSKTKRISCCGNGWTVDVIAFLLSFLFKG